MDVAALNRFVEGDGDGGGGGVAVFVEVHEHLFGFGSQTLSHSIDDPEIGLVRNNALDTADIEFAPLQGFLGGDLHGLDGIFEGLFAFHPQIVQSRGHGVGCRGTATAATGHEEQIGLFAIGTHDGRQEAVAVRAILQDSGAPAIAEQDAGVAIFPIDDRGQFFGTDHEHGVVGAGHDELLGDFESVDEARAGGFEIERSRATRADFMLDEASRGRKRHVGRDGSDDDEIDLFSGDAGLFHGFQGGFRGDVGGEFVFGGQPAFFDAGAAGYPFIRSVDHFFEVGVGESLRGQVGTDTADGAGAALEVEFGSGVFEFRFLRVAHWCGAGLF